MEDKVGNKFGVQITPDDFTNFSSHVVKSMLI